MYFPITNHGGIPIMLGHDGCITTKHLVKDTMVGKKKVMALPHLIANTVDDLARGRVEEQKPIDIVGETSLMKPGKAGKLVRETKTKINMYQELTPEEMEQRRMGKARMRR